MSYALELGNPNVDRIQLQGITYGEFLYVNDIGRWLDA